MKKALSLFISICITISAVFCTAVPAFAQEQTWESGDVYVNYDGDSTLRVYGNGAMADYASVYDVPWSQNNLNSVIETIIIDDGVTAIGNRAFSSMLNANSLTIAPTVKVIGERAFGSCINLTQIDIPSSVESIGKASFRVATKSLGAKLQSFNVSEDNKYYASKDGALYDKALTTLIQIPPASKVTDFTVPKTVTTICEQAGINCTTLESLTILGNVQALGDSMFEKCTSLKEVTLSSGVQTISSTAFNGCTSLEKIVINNENCTIGVGAIPNAQGVTICGKSGSEVEKYATDNNISFEALSAENGDNDVIFNPPTHTHSYTSTVTKQATCTQTGIRTFTCSCGDTYDEVIEKTEHSLTTSTVPATTSKNGKIVTKCENCDTQTTTKTIYYPKTITLSSLSYTYDGTVKKPTVKVINSNSKTISSSNYTVKYSSNKNVGTATVTITFKGNYTGTVKKTFKINPKSTTISSVNAKSKGFTVKWNKQSTQTTGYQIQYSTSSSFENAKTLTFTKNTTTSRTVTSLKASKKYYVRVRTYKTVDGKKYYSAWSKSKSVTTKK